MNENEKAMTPIDDLDVLYRHAAGFCSFIDLETDDTIYLSKQRLKSALLRAEAVEKELAERIKDYNNCVYDFTKTNELKNRVVHAQKNWVLTSGMVKLIEFILNGELFAKEVNER